MQQVRPGSERRRRRRTFTSVRHGIEAAVGEVGRERVPHSLRTVVAELVSGYKIVVVILFSRG